MTSVLQDKAIVRFFDRKVTFSRDRVGPFVYESPCMSKTSACVQGFYSVHGEDALFIARQFYKTTAVVKYLGKQDTGLPGESSNHLPVESLQQRLCTC